MDPIDEKAALAAKQAEADLAVTPPVPATEGDVVPVSDDPELQAEIDKRKAEVDLSDTSSIIKFGSGAQVRLTDLSNEMLEGVRNKDVGPAGEALRSMVTTIRGFDVSELDPDRKPSWWERLMGKTRPVAEFVAKYEDVKGQIDAITDALLSQETVLLKDIKFLDRLYTETLAFYREVGLYISAGSARLVEIDSTLLPKEEADVAAAAPGEAMLEAQQVRDLRAARDELERRVHDMKLTRQVTMQALPSIRLVQENDKSLINKINSTLVNTVPLWKTQLAQAVTIFRSREAAGVVREATDLTNELLKANADNLQQANREIREQMERGVFDIEAVKAANDTLIATINDSLAIADAGKAARRDAEKELVAMEDRLKETLLAAKARSAGTASGGA